ncbi:MAG: cation:H+ antiporter [Chlamydiales bacterium]|jgi:cation:H+ antiporter
MLWSISLIILGGFLLVSGANLLVVSATVLARMFRVSSLTIGLTIVAFGTSAPELLVSSVASMKGLPEVALGNVVGSNIFNILFILGICALITPLTIHQKLIREDLWIMIGVSLLFWGICYLGDITRLWGAFLFLCILLYTFLQVFFGKKEHEDNEPNEIDENQWSSSQLYWNLFLVFCSLAILSFGADCFVKGSVQIALMIGVSELIISLTLVAMGTSLPELATCVVASLRKETDIVVGNIVGSNVFNILGVLGISALLSPEGIPIASSFIQRDILVMAGSAILCFPIFFTGYRISRLEGSFFLILYCAYVTYLASMSVS